MSKETYYRLFLEVIKEERKARSLSYAKLGVKCGSNPETLRRIEIGLNEGSMFNILTMIEPLGLTLTEIERRVYAKADSIGLSR